MSLEARQDRETHFSFLLGSMGKFLKCYILKFILKYIEGCDENFLTLAQIDFLGCQLIVFRYVFDSQYGLSFQVFRYI